MSEFKFNCPLCDQHLKADEQFAGRQIQCPNCNHLIRIPPVPGHTAEYNPQSGMTWNTYISDGRVPPPANLSLEPKPPADGKHEH